MKEENNIAMESTNKTPQPQISEMKLPEGYLGDEPSKLNPEMKIILIGAEEPLSSSILEALGATFTELGEEVNFGVMQPNEVKAYMNRKEEEASQKSMDDFLKDENNVKRAEALAKKLDELFKTEGKWCNIDKLVKKISWDKQELLNNLMSLQTFGFVEARKNVADNLLIRFTITDEQRNKQKADSVRDALRVLKVRMELITLESDKSLLRDEIKAVCEIK